MSNNKAREINSPVIKQLIDETNPEELAKIDAEMTNNKQQTPVEWLEKEQDNLFISYQKGFMSAGRFIFLQHKLFKQAKEMEKEQIEEAFANGVDDEYEWHINNVPRKNRETYYNETYGGGEQ
jgi:hypothetical protein